MMDTTDFHQVWQNEQVRAFIHRCARRYSKRDPIFWQDLVAEGWLGVAQKECQHTAQYYCKCAFRAIRNAYERDNRFCIREENALKKLLDKIENSRED